MTKNEKSAIRGYILNGMSLEQIVKVAGFSRRKIQEIIDELKKELEDGENGGTDRV